MKFSEHSNVLLQRHRCGFCAEAVSAVAIMRQDDCTFCGSSLAWNSSAGSGNVLEALRSKWRIRKWMIMITIAIVSFFAGQIPLLQSLCLALALVAIHLLLIRKPLQWLPTGRKVFAKMDIKLIGVMLTVCNLVINVLVMPFVFVNGLVLAILSILNTFIFVHFSTKIIETRLQWELNKTPFGMQDWIRTALFLGMIFFTTIAGVLIVWGMFELLMSIPVPFMGINFGQLLFGEG